jgi:phage replication O-like protein O
MYFPLSIFCFTFAYTGVAMSSLFRDLNRGAINANLSKNSFKVFNALLEQTLGYGKAIDNLTNKKLAALSDLRLDRFHLALNAVLKQGLFNRRSSSHYDFEYRIGDDFLANYQGEFYTPALSKNQPKISAKKSNKNSKKSSQKQKKAKNSVNHAQKEILKTEYATRKTESDFQKTEQDVLNSEANLRKTESFLLNSEGFSEKQSFTALNLYPLLENLIKQLQLLLPFGQHNLLHAIGEALSQAINCILQATRPNQAPSSENTTKAIDAINQAVAINSKANSENNQSSHNAENNPQKPQEKRENQTPQKNANQQVNQCADQVENQAINQAENQSANQAAKPIETRQNLNDQYAKKRATGHYKNSNRKKNKRVSGGGFLNKAKKSTASPDLSEKLALPDIINSNNHASCYYHLNKLKPQQQKDVLAVFNDMAKRGKIRSSPAGLLVKLAQLAEKDQFTALEKTSKPIAGRNLSSQQQKQRTEQDKAREQRMDEWGEILSLLRFEAFTDQTLEEVAKIHKAEHLLIKYQKEIAQHKAKC